MVYDYDKSIVDRLTVALSDTRVRITPPENFISTVARINKDDIQLPMVNLSRSTITLLKDRQNHSLIMEGGLSSSKNVPLSESDLKRLQMMPIRIDYQLDAWAYSREECDALMRELVWMYLQYPTHRVNIPYGLNISHNFNIFLDDTIEDNSDIIGQADHGEYFRETISLYTDDAYLWKTSKYISNSIDIYASVQ